MEIISNNYPIYPSPSTAASSSEKMRMQKQLQSYCFAAFDLNLYLNTHPTDKRALSMHSDVVKKLNDTKAAYQKMYGPLTANDSLDDNEWRWLDDPWPWEPQQGGTN